jgi:hypothetical protein
MAVSDLDDAGLLDRPSHGTIDRRKALKQLAAAGLLVPVISSITVASAEAQVSCTNPCTSPSCPDFCASNCNPCLCSPDPCTCNPCLSHNCPQFCARGCGGQCDPFCGPIDECFCFGFCNNPGCQGYSTCVCVEGGQLCDGECCLPGTTCVDGVCV